MPNRRFQGRNLPENEFITVDLLPDVRRPRQFNVNIILIVLVAVFFAWLLIYWPLSARQNDLDAALELNNDLANVEEMLEEQVSEYRIDPNVLTFADQIERIDALYTDYENLDKGIQSAILAIEPSAEFMYYSYDAVTQRYTIRMSLSHFLMFDDVLIGLYELDYVLDATNNEPTSPTDTSRYEARFIIEVDIDAFETIE